MNEPFEAHKTANTRLLILYIIFGALFLALITGLAYQQLVKSAIYEKQEKQQSLRRIIQPGPRGDIYDREGRLLVGNRPIFTAVVYLGELRQEFRKEYFRRVRLMRSANMSISRRDLHKQARRMILQKYLNKVNIILGREDKVNMRELERHFSQRMLLPMPIINDLSVEEYALLTEQLPVESPIQVLTDTARHYPFGHTAAHVLGYVSSTNEASREGLPGESLTTFSFKGKVGKAGLEYSQNNVLEGSSGGEIWLVDPVGFQYQLVAQKYPEQGTSITTTLDIDLQIVAEQALGDHVGAVVMLEVDTGEVLALATKPDYNLNDLTPYIPQKVYDKITEEGGWLNRATQGLYPPASPFKLVTAMAALRHGCIDPEEVFDCGPFSMVGNRKFKENCRNGYGQVDMLRALKVSSNVYFYELSVQMGPEKIAQEAKLFGLDQPTGLELPFETKRALIPDTAWKMNNIGERWRGGDSANMGIGQGFLRTTPLHMACFTASLARNETRTKPTLLHIPNRSSVNHGAEPIGLRNSHYRTIVEGMEQSVIGGSSKYVKIPQVNVAAKTGTGQIRHHGKRLTTPWVVAFAPAENPKVALVALVEGTVDDSLWGGTTAGPIAHNVLYAYFEKHPELHKGNKESLGE